MQLSLENLENTKRRNLIGLTVFFCLWQISNIATYHFTTILPKPLYTLFSITLLMGALGYVWFTYLFYKNHKLLKQNPKLFHALHDERDSWINSRATSYGLLATIIYAGILFAASIFFSNIFENYISSPNGVFTAHSIIIVAFISTTISMIILDKK